MPLGLSGLRGVSGAARADVVTRTAAVGAGAAGMTTGTAVGEVGTDGAGVTCCHDIGSGLTGVVIVGAAVTGTAVTDNAVGGVLGQCPILLALQPLYAGA